MEMSEVGMGNDWESNVLVRLGVLGGEGFI